jgi:hypothetical protein
MSARSEKPESVAYRHVYTYAPKGFQRGPGFQTVACASKLEQDKLFRKVEQLVESYKLLASDEPPCRQLLQFSEMEAYALTTFTALDDSPEDRGANFLADTLVVPREWLKQGDWDAAAAFDVLKWLRPAELTELPKTLDPEPIDHLEPRPSQRLARLIDLVPQEVLRSLLLSLVQQSNGLRPVRILEAKREHPAELQEVVTLLPLVVPPTSRTYRDDQLSRCLGLRTRSPFGGMAPPADITGYPAAAAENLDQSDGILIDLGGRLPSTEHHDRFGRDYVEWLLSILRERDWSKLDSLYEKARDAPGPVFFSTFKTLLDTRSRSSQEAERKEREPSQDAPDPPAEELGSQAAATPSDLGKAAASFEPPAAGPTVAEPQPPADTVAAIPSDESLPSSPVQARRKAWELRSKTEGALWEVLESHREQLEKLVQTLRDDFATDLQKAANKLRQDVAEIRKQMEKTELKAIQLDLDETDKRFREQVPHHLEERLEELERKLSTLEARLLESGSGLSAAHTEEADAAVPPPSEKKPQDSKARLLKLRRWLSRNRRATLITACALLLVLALTSAWRLLKNGQPDHDQIQRQPGPPQQQGIAPLLQRVQDGAVASPLLAAVAQHPDFAEDAGLEILAIGLSRGVQVDEGMDCALLQAALRKHTSALSQPGIEVDGACGRGTVAALIATAPDCCRQLQPTQGSQADERLRYCFLARYLQLGEPATGGTPEACSDESPWRAGRSWKTEEASRALKLFREAALAVEGRNPLLANSLRGLDPAKSARPRETLRGARLTPEQAEKTLELAWVAWSRQPLRLSQLTEAQIEQLTLLVTWAASPAQRATQEAGTQSEPKGER